MLRFLEKRRCNKLQSDCSFFRGCRWGAFRPPGKRFCPPWKFFGPPPFWALAPSYAHPPPPNSGNIGLLPPPLKFFSKKRTLDWIKTFLAEKYSYRNSIHITNFRSTSAIQKYLHDEKGSLRYLPTVYMYNMWAFTWFLIDVLKWHCTARNIFG